MGIYTQKKINEFTHESNHLKNITVIHDVPIDVCNPSPCAANAVCRERNGVGSCTCMSNYFGDPYVNCKPECMQNSECSYDKACVNNKCVDACAINGICGSFAECRVVNHAPMCHCIAGYTGNPSVKCYANREYLPPCKKHNQIQTKETLVHSLIIYIPFLHKIPSQKKHSKTNTRSYRSLCSIAVWPV